MRKKLKKLTKKGPCRVYWGSHGCHKQRGHIGNHRCMAGCPHPERIVSEGNSWRLYGEDVENLELSVDRVEERV